MPDEIVVVATYTYPPEADMAKLKLEAEGIECIIANATTSQMVLAGGVKVLVRAEDADRAAEILGEETESSWPPNTWGTTDEITYNAPTDQAFVDVQKALGKMGKVTEADPGTLTVEAKSKCFLNGVGLKVEIKPEEGKSRLEISGYSHDIRAVGARKCIKRFLKILNGL